ncbi:IS4 family transposase [Paenibacillus sp. SZ31]|uniref:IS4 family transposase n=1 Tax=Paenibacillus sp. SZ31 TaxID=2725555 RepID=UPI00146B4ED7|nr:IS4 family transposase [Paenibacillus sp. SZ31]NMI06191.1 IS4 family transposase [Paenibacillus sp. SZ31]
MKKITPFMNIVQTLLSEEEVEAVVQAVGYHDKGKKFTVYTLFQFLTHAAAREWESYRAGVDRAILCGLPSVNYSTFSKKAADVPYEVFKRLFEIVAAQCNRSTRRKLRIPSALLLVDSTTITVGQTRLPWAVFHGKRSGVKLHVAYDASANLPAKVVETVATKHDGPMGEKLANPDFIMVENRAYGKIERFDTYATQQQYFVIRIKENMTMTTHRSLQRQVVEHSNVTRDITCRLGTEQCRSEKRHRVVFFQDDHGNEIRVVTNLLHLSAEQIAAIYKARWGIEVFFRWIKQHLNVSRLFGTTENAVYGQLFAALIADVLLQWLYNSTQPFIMKCKSLALVSFVRLFLLGQLSPEWRVAISLLLDRCKLSINPIIG